MYSTMSERMISAPVTPGIGSLPTAAKNFSRRSAGTLSPMMTVGTDFDSRGAAINFPQLMKMH